MNVYLAKCCRRGEDDDFVGIFKSKEGVAEACRTFEGYNNSYLRLGHGGLPQEFYDRCLWMLSKSDNIAILPSDDCGFHFSIELVELQE